MHDYLLTFSALCLLSLNSECKYGTVVHTVYYTAREIKDRPECRSWCPSTSSVHRQAGSGYAVAGLVPSYALLHLYWCTGPSCAGRPSRLNGHCGCSSLEERLSSQIPPHATTGSPFHTGKMETQPRMGQNGWEEGSYRPIKSFLCIVCLVNWVSSICCWSHLHNRKYNWFSVVITSYLEQLRPQTVCDWLDVALWGLCVSFIFLSSVYWVYSCSLC